MIFATLLSYFLSTWTFAAEPAFLKQIHVEQKGASTLVHFDMSQTVDVGQIETRFLRRTIEWDLAAIQLKKDKMFVDVSGADINNVYASNHDSKGLRIRVNLNNDKTASNYHEQVRFIKNKNQITLVIDGSVATLNHNIKELSRMYDVKSESLTQMEEHIAKQSVLRVEPEVEATVATTATSENPAVNETEVLIDETKDEKEIPLVAKSAKAAEAGMPSMGRAAAGIIAILFLLASVYFVNKKLGQKRAGAPFNHDSIKVVSQKYLGPKRQLTLVRVSGEYLLLGVTDHNISLIKQLAIVDDEIPDLEPQNFKTAVKKITQRSDDMDAQAQEVEDSFSVSSLSDVRKIFHKRKYIDETDM
ncbi:flagellar biosynthetic protein FliO [bacterium]|nr:flagellar biosynthetic protein FliO [bacterium]